MRCALLLVLLASTARAQVNASCDASHDVDKYQLLRRLSLDLRGRIPTYEEYTALDSQNAVPTQLVKEWLTSDDFRQVMRRYHQDLFWPNLSTVPLNNINAQVSLIPGTDIWSVGSPSKRKLFRGAPEVLTSYGAQCGDFEQTHFTAGFTPDASGLKISQVNGVTVKQEGWRLVTPYWDPSIQLKVCAFDAQEVESVTSAKGPIDCGTPAGDARVECGCGPNLRFCYGPLSVTQTIRSALIEQLLLMVDEVTTGGQPYTTLLTSRQAPLNGPLAFWKKYLAPHYSSVRVFTAPDPAETVPVRAFTDTTWSFVDRGSDLHSGVLTAPAYLLRFQTNRGRANRFRNDFECESFVPPSDIESAADGCSESGTDLTKRCTCRYCHRTLEPLAAHWGQFAEAGTTLLSNETQFPRMNKACIGVNLPNCTRFYVTASDADNPGALLAYQYADANHADITTALEAGPRKRVTGAIASGAFARCTVKRAWSYLLKRDMHVAGSATDELATLDALSKGFANANYSLPWLFESIVTQSQYRSIR